MGDTLAGGRYRPTWRSGRWVVRSPDGRTVKEFDSTHQGRAAAWLWADRANAKLRAVDQR